MSIDATQFLSQLHELGAGIRNNAMQAMRSAVKAAEDDARSTKLFNDGPTANLRNKTLGTVDGLTGELRANTKYAAFVENGTAPHVIEARGGALRFVVAGHVVFAKRVNHPGTAERPFMQHASDVGEKTLEYGTDYFTDYAIGKFNQSG